MNKKVRFVNVVIKSKLGPVNKGLVLEQTKTKPLYFIKELINNLENGMEYMDAMIKTSHKFKFSYDTSSSKP